MLLQRVDLQGQVFGRLTVVKFSHKMAGKHNMWECLCSCGNKSIVSICHLRGGKTKSCGCLKTELQTIHGHCVGYKKTPEFVTYTAMLQRCYNPNHSKYSDYGGRGITVCKRWLNSFVLFLKDMGLKPSKKHSIERKRVNGNYTQKNCRWAIQSEQMRNKRTNVWINYNGKRMVQKDFSDLISAEYRQINARLKKGHTINQIAKHYLNKKAI